MYEDFHKIIDKIILVVITCLTERNNNTEIFSFLLNTVIKNALKQSYISQDIEIASNIVERLLYYYNLALLTKDGENLKKYSFDT